MSAETRFIDGLIVKAPNDRAPDYVKAKLAIRREEMIAWLQKQSGDWINADIKVSQSGKWYVAVDDWKPGGNASAQRNRPQQPQRQQPAADDFDDDIPFN